MSSVINNTLLLIKAILTEGVNLILNGDVIGSSNPMPVEIVGGGNDLSVLIVEDSTGTKYIRREVIDAEGTVTITYENFDGTPATPVAPITVASTVLPVGASTSAKQDELRGVQGTGTSYDPPTGGSGVFGWLSGIYKEIKDRLPASLGVKTAANSLSVTLSSDGAFSTNFGAVADAAATSDTGSFSHISLLKRLLSKSSGSPTDRSSTITTGGASQVAAAALSTRKAYFFQNISSENMWGSFVGAAAPNTAGSFPIFPNGVIRSTQVCETTALSIYGTTTGQKFTMWEM